MPAPSRRGRTRDGGVLAPQVARLGLQVVAEHHRLHARNPGPCGGGVDGVVRRGDHGDLVTRERGVAGLGRLAAGHAAAALGWSPAAAPKRRWSSTGVAR